MLVLTPSPEARDDGDFAVEQFGTKGSVGINLSEDRQTVIVLQTIEDADRLIAAACKAKELLLGVPLAHEPVAPRCTSEHVNLGGARLQCSLHQGHPGRHTAALAIAPGSVPTAEWDDEPDAPEPGACACGHPGYEHIHAAPQPCTQCECKAFGAAPSGGVMFGPFDGDTAVSLA